MNKLSLLKSVFVFQGLDESLLAQIAQQLKETTFKAGGVIFSEGQRADSFYIVDSGAVTIAKRIGPDKEKVLAVLGPGSVFGEMAFFSDSPRTANAAVKTDAVLWKIDHADFMEFINREPKAGLRILSGLLEVSMGRLEETSRELATIFQTGKAISSGKSLTEILKNVQDELLLAVPEADSAATFLYNEFNREFDPVIAPEGAKELPPGHPLIVNLKENDTGVMINDDAAREKYRLKDSAIKSRALLAAPVAKSGELLGVFMLINSQNENAFKNSHQLLLSSVSGQLAEAIENIRHHQEERDRLRLNNAKQTY